MIFWLFGLPEIIHKLALCIDQVNKPIKLAVISGPSYWIPDLLTRKDFFEIMNRTGFIDIQMF